MLLIYDLTRTKERNFFIVHISLIFRTSTVIKGLEIFEWKRQTAGLLYLFKLLLMVLYYGTRHVVGGTCQRPSFFLTIRKEEVLNKNPSKHFLDR